MQASVVFRKNYLTAILRVIFAPAFIVNVSKMEEGEM